MKITIGITIEMVNHVNSINIESVLSQTLNSNDFKIIMVNYKNDYAANYYYNKLKLRYNNLEQIKVANSYKGNMKNEVLKALDTEYVAFIEEDMRLKPDALSELLNLIENNDADMIINHETCKSKKNRSIAKVIEDELLADVACLTMYKSKIIIDNGFEFIQNKDKNGAMKAFYAKYLANSHGVVKYNKSCLFDLIKEENKQEIKNKDEYFSLQEEIMSSLSTGVAMTIENKIQAISQQYLAILHSNTIKKMMFDKGNDQVDTKIWLRRLSEFTNRYLLDACMVYIPRQDLNLVRAIRNCDLEGVEIHLENIAVKKELIPKTKHIKEVTQEQDDKLFILEDYDTAKRASAMTNKKLEIIETRINKLLEKGE